MRIIVANNQEIVRAGLKAVIEQIPGAQWAGEAADGRSAINLIEQSQPDIAIVQASLPELNGIELANQIRSSSIKTKVIMMAETVDRQIADRALRAGVAGYLLCESSVIELQLAIQAAFSGNIYVSPKVASIVLANLTSAESTTPKSLFETLTTREREVLQFVAEGLSTVEISTRLKISIRTVDAHRRRLAKKLNIKGVAELTRYAIREGLTSL